MITYTPTPATNGYVLTVYQDSVDNDFGYNVRASARQPETYVFRKLSGAFAKIKALEKTAHAPIEATFSTGTIVPGPLERIQRATGELRRNTDRLLEMATIGELPLGAYLEVTPTSQPGQNIRRRRLEHTYNEDGNITGARVADPTSLGTLTEGTGPDGEPTASRTDMSGYSEYTTSNY